MIDLKTNTLEVVLSHSDTRCTYGHFVRDIPVSPDGRTNSYHEHFSIKIYTLRSARYRNSTASNERDSG